MDQGSDDIRQDIEDTRAALDSKLSLLESKANEVTDNVKQAFDVKAQVSERPWAALGAAVLAGYVLGNLGEDSTPKQPYNGTTYTATDYNQHANAGYNNGPSTMDSIKSGATDFLSQFDDEINLIKGAAVATITDLIRQTVRDVAPMIGDRVDGLLREHGANLGLNTAGSPSSAGTYNNAAGSSSSTGTYGNTAANSGKSTSSAPGQSFSETNTASADYDEIGGAQNRYGAPPTVNNSGSEYYETYSPSPEQEDRGSRATIKTYNQ